MPFSGTNPRRLFRLAAALVGLAGVALLFHSLLAWTGGRRLARHIVNFFSFFTIQTSLLTVAALALPELWPKSRPGRFFARPGTRLAVAVYGLATALVYFLALRRGWNPRGAALIGEAILHYVLPALYLADWALLGPRGVATWRLLPAVLAYPLVYAAAILARGALTGVYPYSFLNAQSQGYTRVLANCLVLGLCFAGLTLLLMAGDKRLRTAASAPRRD